MNEHKHPALSRALAVPRQVSTPELDPLFEQPLGNAAMADQIELDHDESAGLTSPLAGLTNSLFDADGAATKDAGLAVDLAQPTGWEKLTSGDQRLAKGDRGALVGFVQDQLIARGFNTGGADQSFGQGTINALKSFQHSMGLEPTGVVDSATAAALSRKPENDPRNSETYTMTSAPVSVAPDAFVDTGLQPHVLRTALTAFDHAWANGDTTKTTLTVIDYSLPDDAPRMWVIDLASGKLLNQTLVAHGAGSGQGRWTEQLSNADGSHASSIGVLKTGGDHHTSKPWKHGIKLHGLEEGFNDNAYSRAVVMHNAVKADGNSYVNPTRARDQSVGQSYGCPAMDPAQGTDIKNTVRDGTILVNYFPDAEWLKKSKYLNGAP